MAGFVQAEHRNGRLQYGESPNLHRKRVCSGNAFYLFASTVCCRYVVRRSRYDRFTLKFEKGGNGRKPAGKRRIGLAVMMPMAVQPIGKAG